MAKGVHEIRISLPVEMELDEKDLQNLDTVLTIITDKYEDSHPGRVMWVFGQGSLMLSNPFMMSDDEGLKFDDSVYHLEISEREAYPEEVERIKKRQERDKRPGLKELSIELFKELLAYSRISVPGLRERVYNHIAKLEQK